MTEQNRVTPLGDVVALPLRGAWTGNRGRIHEGHRIVRFHSGSLWITCALDFRGRWNAQWQPRHYTFLFFHDEAVSLAAGHRPCAECRHGAYSAYRAAWAEGLAVPSPSAREINERLHAERLVRATHRRRLHETAWSQLPDGAFVLLDDGPWLVLGRELVGWGAAGYGARRRRPAVGSVFAITPPSSIAAIRAGYPVQIDDTARA
jgi:hypothetical protein